MPVGRGAHQRHPEGRRLGEIGAHGGALVGAQLADLLLAVQLDDLPGRCRLGRDDLDRLVVAVAEPGHQVGVPVNHGVHRVAQPRGVERAGDGDVELPGIEVVAA
ncbi:hypothetical protein MAHJHV48_37770 [Mycobacterium avium subsp. hominissuis]